MICEKLKTFYHPETSWVECYKQIAEKFTVVKQKARKFYVGQSDIEILKELRNYSTDDLKEMYEG